MSERIKTLKFSPTLIPAIMQEQKTATWRLWDDKNLSVGDEISFLSSETKVEFAKAKLTKVVEKQFKYLNEEDWFGHEKLIVLDFSLVFCYTFAIVFFAVRLSE